MDMQPIRGEVRRAGYRRVAHGLYRPHERDLTSKEEHLADLTAWLHVLPPGAVFTHITAAWLQGWWLPLLPEHLPVFAAVGRDAEHPRRAGLVCSRLERVSAASTISGLPVDAPGEVLLRAARDLSFLDLTVMLDSALRAGGAPLARQVSEMCRTSRPGVKRLRAVLAAADARSESAWETLLRLFYVSVGVDVVPQREMIDAGGRFVARADLWLVGTRVIAEYDGAHHLDVAQQRHDLRRARRLTEAGLDRRGYSSADLVVEPLGMLREVDQVLGRPHVPGRLRPWVRQIRESTYSVEGRRRLQNRWYRRTGVIDWAKTA